MGLFRYPFNSSHYSIFCSQYWNVPNNMLFEGKLGSNLSSLCVLSRAGERGKQGFTASHGAVISNSWQSQTKTLFLWLPHCNNRVQRTDCLQAKNQRPRNTENSSSPFFFVTKHCCYLHSAVLKRHPLCPENWTKLSWKWNSSVGYNSAYFLYQELKNEHIYLRKA